MSSNPFDVAPPSQEDVDRKRPLRFVTTPVSDYIGRLKEVGKFVSKAENFKAADIVVTLVSTLDGAEAVDDININGRTESRRITTALFETTGEGEDKVVTLDGSGDPKPRTDDGAGKAYAMSNEAFVELFQALGALKRDELDLKSLGINSGDDVIATLQGFLETPIQVRVVHEAMRDFVKLTPQAKAQGKKAPLLRDDEGKIRYKSVISNFSPVGNGVV